MAIAENLVAMLVCNGIKLLDFVYRHACMQAEGARQRLHRSCTILYLCPETSYHLSVAGEHVLLPPASPFRSSLTHPSSIIVTMSYLLLEDISTPFISQIGHLAATHQVLTTVELLEKILLHADAEALLCAQRVSKTCYDTIRGSRRLQKKLFFGTVYRDGWSGLKTDYGWLLSSTRILRDGIGRYM